MHGSLVEMLRALVYGDFEAVDRYVYEVEWNAATDLLHAAFWIAANQRFDAQTSQREIADYVAAVHRRYDTLNLEVAEALIRAACGEEHLVDGMHPDTVIPAEMLLVHVLAAEQNQTDEQLDRFMSDTMALAQRSSA